MGIAILEHINRGYQLAHIVPTAGPALGLTLSRDGSLLLAAIAPHTVAFIDVGRAIAVGNRHPEISLPAAFEAFRAILRNTGVNMASTVQLSATREMTTDEAIAARDGENPTAAGHTRVSIRHLYHAGLWAAIRAGWREGYSAEADHFIVSGQTPRDIAKSVEAAKDAIRHAAEH